MGPRDNQYLFKVGNVPVKVEFLNDASTLQQCLENFLIKNIGKGMKFIWYSGIIVMC